MSYGCYGINFCVYKNLQMTTAKELMIGNLFLFTDEPKGIRSITGTHIEYAERYNSWFNSFFEPIPITEEWLLKFGFKKSDHDSGGYKWHNGMFYILELAKDAFYCDYILIFSIHYIHQLQNLYLSLTQKELTYPI
jgi:hypothetical protein